MEDLDPRRFTLLLGADLEANRRARLLIQQRKDMRGVKEQVLHSRLLDEWETPLPALLESSLGTTGCGGFFGIDAIEAFLGNGYRA